MKTNCMVEVLHYAGVTAVRCFYIPARAAGRHRMLDTAFVNDQANSADVVFTHTGHMVTKTHCHSQLITEKFAWRVDWISASHHTYASHCTTAHRHSNVSHFHTSQFTHVQLLLYYLCVYIPIRPWASNASHNTGGGKADYDLSKV